MAKDVLLITPAPVYTGKMTRTMRIDEKENELKITNPELSFDERLMKARLLIIE